MDKISTSWIPRSNRARRRMISGRCRAAATTPSTINPRTPRASFGWSLGAHYRPPPANRSVFPGAGRPARKTCSTFSMRFFPPRPVTRSPGRSCRSTSLCSYATRHFREQRSGRFEGGDQGRRIELRYQFLAVIGDVNCRQTQQDRLRRSSCVLISKTSGSRKRLEAT